MAESSHPAHQHHFRTLEQQRQAASLGMWVFLAQEIMFFGGLFLGYTVYRVQYPEAFAMGSHMLSIGWGGFNTLVLILSSLTVALSVRAAQHGRDREIVRWLVATLVLGAVFLGVKYIEYSAKFEHHLVPGYNFEYHAPDDLAGAAHAAAEALDPRHMEIFFSFYFAMTAMHALHMIIGIGLLFWLIKLARQRRFDANYYSPVEMFGLYWHFVDIVWIFLFPMLYLIGRHI